MKSALSRLGSEEKNVKTQIESMLKRVSDIPTFTRVDNGIRVTNTMFDFIILDLPSFWASTSTEADMIAKALNARLPHVGELQLISDYRDQIKDLSPTFCGLFSDAIYGTDEAVNGCVCALGFKDRMWDIDDGGWLYERMFFKVVVDSQ